jgi:hypothetical protein
MTVRCPNAKQADVGPIGIASARREIITILDIVFTARSFAHTPVDFETRLSLATLLHQLIPDDSDDDYGPVDRALIEAALFPLIGADARHLAVQWLREKIRFHHQIRPPDGVGR